ncbi:MAG TPA: plastocyanin/azurin family copper-binding protein, partial [Gemmatimonadales bacterium]|nr:plastocyanin/azurin family copper-binding protein [Gemmatimonadales bacterium]
MNRCFAAGALFLMSQAGPVRGQSVLERTPNVQGTWTLAPGAPVFIFSHRFEILNGGDELINIPTLTTAVGLPLRLTGGVSFTSYSEVHPDKLTGNELEYWLKTTLLDRPRSGAAAILAYNSASGSVDAALSARAGLGRLGLVGEIRGFSDGFGSGNAELGYTAGAMVRLTPYLALQGDLGGSSAASSDAVWSAGVAVEIPGTPHSFSLHATNGGATTLQGASQRKVTGPQDVRYGFTFTLPLGSRRQWSRVFQGDAAAAGPPGGTPAADTVVAEMRQVAFQPREIRIPRGRTVIWVNRDPTGHTVHADDDSWQSALLQEGESYARRFDRPGRYP